MPFSNRWFYGDALYIVDPWLYLMLGAGVWLASRARSGRAAAAPRGAGRRCAGGDLRAGDARLESVGAARSARRTGASGRSADTRFMVTPVVVNPFQSRSGDRRRRSLREGQLWFDPLPHFRPAGFGDGRKASNNRRRSAALTAAARARLPALVALSVRGQWIARPRRRGCWLNDYRYATAGAYGWSVLRRGDREVARADGGSTIDGCVLPWPSSSAWPCLRRRWRGVSKPTSSSPIG